MTEQTTQEITITDVFKAYVGTLHLVLGIALTIIVGLGVGIVYQAHLNQKNVELVAQLLSEKEQLVIENVELQELTKPIQERIRKGASYIHDKHKVPMELAMKYSHKEMVESLNKGVPFAVGLAITEQESGFKSKAISYTGCCYGLKQVHLKVWRKEMGVTLKDLYDPNRNIEISYEILDRYRANTGTLYGAIKRYYGSTSEEENQQYASQVLQRSKRIAAYINQVG